MLGAGSRLARGRRRRERRRRRADARSARLRVVGSIVGDDARRSAPGASSATSRSSVRARRSASGNVARPRPADRRRPDDPRPGAPVLVSALPSVTASPRRVEKPWGWELVWAEADDYVGQAPLRARRRVAEPPVPRGQGRVVARPGGPRAARARRASAASSRRSRSGRRRVPLPPGTVHRVTAIEDTLVVEVSTPQLDDVVRARGQVRTRGHVRLRENLHTTLIRLRACSGITIGEASRRSGWSPRMLRYLEQEGLVVPAGAPPATAGTASAS